jgi:hypothetical protein
MKPILTKAIQLLSIIICLSLSACSSSEKDVAFDPLTPIPKKPQLVDPSDHQLVEAINNYILERKGPAFSRYEFTRIDLNEDGLREGLVLMKGPYQYWCGPDGCLMGVFKAHNGGFNLLNEVTPVRGPLIVSEEKSNGWKNLLIKITGRDFIRAHDVILRHNGTNYPSSPILQPKVLSSIQSNNLPGVRIFP